MGPTMASLNRSNSSAAIQFGVLSGSHRMDFEAADVVLTHLEAKDIADMPRVRIFGVPVPSDLDCVFFK